MDDDDDVGDNNVRSELGTNILLRTTHPRFKWRSVAISDELH